MAADPSITPATIALIVVTVAVFVLAVVLIVRLIGKPKEKS